MSVPTVILSRKGFDSSAGGEANWICGKKLIPIPIPESGTGISYEDLQFTEDESFRNVMSDLYINQYSEAHPDPSLSDLYKCEKTKDWENSLGQCGNALSSLRKYSIGPKSIFLFFGWFNKIEKINKKINGKNHEFWKYTKLEGYHNNGVHMIYGFLEVGDVIDINDKDRISKNPWIKSHPHYKLKDQITQYPGENKIFLANRSGIFDFHDNLILTQKNQSRSNWKLPEWMAEEKVEFTHFNSITTVVTPQNRTVSLV